MARLTGSSYAKIVIAIILALLLFGIAGLGSCTWKGLNNWSSIVPAGSANHGNADIPVSNIKSIEINWAAGAVDIAAIESGTDIKLAEDYSGSRAQEMQWYVSGDTLKIDYGSWASCFSVSKKNLRVEIPKDLAESINRFDITGASGKYSVSGIKCQDYTTKLASGSLRATGVETKDLRLDTASGSANFQGDISGKLVTKTASGDVTVTSKSTVPANIDADLASGTVIIAMPDNNGFTADVKKASGNFNTDFSTTQSNGNYIYKDGGMPISVKMASGNFSLKQS